MHKPHQASMTIYLHDNSAKFRFELVGVLNQDAAGELERCWIAGCSILNGRTMEVDCSQVTGIDDAATPTIERMAGCGVVFAVPESSSVLPNLRCAGSGLRVIDAEKKSLASRLRTLLLRRSL